jgi:hypothetical protein
MSFAVASEQLRSYHTGEGSVIAKRRYDRSKAGKARTREGAIQRYLEVPFIAWDGEGVTREDGKHVYTLLANSMGDAWFGTADKPLTTQTCLQALLKTAARYPNAHHVIYGGSYDTNMFLSDCTREEIARVYRHFTATIGHGRYKLRYRAGKSLWIRDTLTGNKLTLWDVVSFFQCSFVKACDSYLGEDAWADAAMVKEQKALRSTFTDADAAQVLRYCRAELDALVSLMTELRERLNRADLRLSRWDGPGACASALLKREGVKRAMSTDMPEDVARAGRFAYAGGRFEIIRFGCDAGPAWEYDICSAYPAAMRDVPNLARGAWHHDTSGQMLRDFALYRVRYTGLRSTGPTPFYRRESNGTVCYPYVGEGWYYGPEVRSALKHRKRYGRSARIEIVESWQYVPDEQDKPFAFITDMYARRLALKRAGDGAHVGYKLSLNSLYGKTAQQTGWMPATADRPQRIPPYHQLEWAGYVTSATRARIYEAAMSNPDAIIAFETDALFSSEPLQLPLGNQLGEWEVTEFANLSYFQSGLYTGTLTDGTEVVKTRGIEASSLDLDLLRQAFVTAQPVEGVTRRFVGMGVALQSRWDEWQQWQTRPRMMNLFPNGKRDHPGCFQCGDHDGLRPGVWHETMVPMGMMMSMSCEFPVEWINPNPEMAALAGMRLEGMEQWQEEGGAETWQDE